MLTKNTDTEGGTQLNDQTTQALPKRQFRFRRFRFFITRALPGEGPHQRQDDRANHREHDTGIEEGDGIIFAEMA